jgi:hypothetical protein
MECRSFVKALRLAALAFLMIASSATLRAAGREVVLVVSANSPVADLEPLEVRKLFLGLPVLRNAQALHPVRNESDEQLSRVFLQHVVAMSQSAYDRRILSQAMQQGRPRPLVMKSTEALLATLEADPLAVTYVWVKDLPVSRHLRILRVLWTE